MSVSTVYDDVVVGTYEGNSDEEPGQDARAGSGDADAWGGEGLPANGGKAKRKLPADAPEPCRGRCLGDGEGAAKCARSHVPGELRRQIEYYFSDTNLSQDAFFHGKISEDPDGWLDASWLLGCPRVVEMGVSDDADIEEALAGSSLETRRPQMSACDAASSAGLQVRRPGGRSLPALLKAGWLREKIAARREAAAGGGGGAGRDPEGPPHGPAVVAAEGTAGPSEEEDAEEATPGGLPAAEGPAVTVGARAMLRGGDYEGQVGQVLALDDDEATLALRGGDVVTVALAELAPAGAAAA